MRTWTSAFSIQPLALFLSAAIDPQALNQFALIISLLVSIGAGVASIAAFFHARRTQRREISFAHEMASKDELLHLVKDVGRIEDEIAKVRETMKEDRLLIMAAGEARHEKTLDRITRLDDILGGLRDRIPK